MFYAIGEYAWPGINFFSYCCGYAVLVLATAGAVGIIRGD